MPFKSQAQRRKFAELLVKADISPETRARDGAERGVGSPRATEPGGVQGPPPFKKEEWNRETGGRKLPERVTRKAASTTARKRKPRTSRKTASKARKRR
jgi:hypothetical protein